MTLSDLVELFDNHTFEYDQHVFYRMVPDYRHTLLRVEYTGDKDSLTQLDDSGYVLLEGMVLNVRDVSKSRFRVVAPSGNDPSVPECGDVNLYQLYNLFAKLNEDDNSERDFVWLFDELHDACSDFSIAFKEDDGQFTKVYPEGINSYETPQGYVLVFETELLEDEDF